MLLDDRDFKKTFWRFIAPFSEQLGKSQLYAFDIMGNHLTNAQDTGVPAKFLRVHQVQIPGRFNERLQQGNKRHRIPPSQGQEATRNSERFKCHKYRFSHGSQAVVVFRCFDSNVLYQRHPQIFMQQNPKRKPPKCAL